MGAADHKCVRLRIEGRVQGVWYRGWVVKQAQTRRLAGWVRNRMDDSVEVLFAGPAAAVEEMVALCRQGPPAARVDNIVASPGETPDDPGFQQRPTG
jgi:acylphosphatase